MKKYIVLLLSLFVLIGCSKDYGGPSKKQFDNFISSVNHLADQKSLHMSNKIILDNDEADYITMRIASSNIEMMSESDLLLEIESSFVIEDALPFYFMGVYHVDENWYLRVGDLKSRVRPEDLDFNELIRNQNLAQILQFTQIQEVPGLAKDFMRTAFKVEGNDQDFTLELQMDSLIGKELNKQILNQTEFVSVLHMFNPNYTITSFNGMKFKIQDNALDAIELQIELLDGDTIELMSWIIEFTYLDDDTSIEFPSFDEYMEI